MAGQHCLGGNLGAVSQRGEKVGAAIFPDRARGQEEDG